MFRCNRCGEEFWQPDTRTVRENLDGENGWWTYDEPYCPCCGSADIDEAAEDEEDEE